MPKRYIHDPISEVTAEFRFLPGNPWDGSEPGRLYERVKAEFPKRESGFSLEQELTTTENEISQRVTPLPKLRFIRTDDSSFIQISQHTLSVHNLAPYIGWDSFLPVVLEAVHQYRDIACPKGLNRVGLRYINLVEIASESVEMEDYFELYPYRGPGLPTDYAAVRALLHFTYPDTSDILRAQISDVPSREVGLIAFALDFDFFTSGPNQVEWSLMQAWLDRAHDRINEAFEGSIKQRLREQFGLVDKQ